LKLDGPRLMGGKAVLDRRREQLANLVRKSDNRELMLLQGYVELLSGNRESGLDLMAKSGLVPIQ
jgi:hypothetical protein